MAHEITSKDGLVLAGKSAWHGLGTIVEEAPTPHEALRIANLDWKVITTPHIEGEVRTDSAYETIVSKDWKFTVREDTLDILGCVTKGYQPIQNEMLADFAYALADRGDVVKVETAGSVYGGKNLWFLLRSESFDVGKDDEIQPFILLSNGHNGSMSFSGRETSIRVVCNNTLSYALSQGRGSVFKLRHTSNIMDRIEEARESLNLYQDGIREFQTQTRNLSNKTLNKDQVREFFLKMYTYLEGGFDLYPSTKEETRKYNRAQENIFEIKNRFEYECDTNSYDRTAWTAFNATTSWLQNRTRSKDKEVKAYQKLFGTSSEKSNAAFKHSLALADSI